MPAWQIVLIVAALVAAAFDVAAALSLWRDPHALVRAEFARERMALGFARRVVEIDGIRLVYDQGGSPTPAAPAMGRLHGFAARTGTYTRAPKRLRCPSPPL